MKTDGNFENRVVDAIERVKGIFPGDNLLDEIKALLIGERVFRIMFGDKGERILLNEVPSYNETILPLLELNWDSELFPGSDLRTSGSISARVLFPNNLLGKLDFHRKVALALARFFQGPAFSIFKKVSGLIKIGEDLQVQYDRLFNTGAIKIPAMILTIPFVIDLQRFRIENPEIDLRASLDEELIADLETYFIEIENEEGEVLIPKSVLFKI